MGLGGPSSNDGTSVVQSTITAPKCESQLLVTALTQVGLTNDDVEADAEYL
jgi:hypothetical protein